MIFSKKVITFALCAIAALAMLVSAGCGGEKQESSKKVLKVGMECGYAPYNWSQTDDKNGAVKIAGTSEYAYGYDVMMAKKLADAMGAELEIHKIEWDGLAPAVSSGKIDAVIAGMSITSKRKQSVDFTLPYYYASVVALTTKDSKYADAKTLSDLSGAKATSQLNTVWYDVMVDQIPQVDKLPAIGTVPGMIVALTSGKVNLLITDEPTAMAAVASNPELVVLTLDKNDDFKVSQEDVEIGIALKKGNKELAAEMNKTLKNMTEKDFRAMMAEATKKQPLAN